MDNLVYLRKLSEYQQYATLRENCENSWYENQHVAVLPLLATAYHHLGEVQLVQ